MSSLQIQRYVTFEIAQNTNKDKISKLKLYLSIITPLKTFQNTVYHRMLMMVLEIIM